MVALRGKVYHLEENSLGPLKISDASGVNDGVFLLLYKHCFPSDYLTNKETKEIADEKLVGWMRKGKKKTT